MTRRKGSFAKGLDDLIENTPKHSIKGGVEVNQVYAHYQHEHLELHHPRGGQAFYLKQPLFTRYKQYLRTLGKAAPKGDLRRAMITNMEDLSHQVMLKAPWEYMDLRNSGHPTVDIDNEVAYDRPPLVRRLSDEELRHKEQYGYLSRRRRHEV